MTDIKQLINDLENLDNEETREKAALDLAKIGSDSDEVIEALCKRAKNDPCSEVREIVIYGLGQTRSEKAIPPLLDCLEEEDLEIRWVSVEALGEIASEKAIEHLIKRLDKEDVWNVRASIVKSLAKIGSYSEKVIQALNKRAQKDESCFVKREAEFALSHVPTILKLRKLFLDHKYKEHLLEMYENMKKSSDDILLGIWGPPVPSPTGSRFRGTPEITSTRLKLPEFSKNLILSIDAQEKIDDENIITDFKFFSEDYQSLPEGIEMILLDLKEEKEFRNERWRSDGIRNCITLVAEHFINDKMSIKIIAGDSYKIVKFEG